MPIFREIMVRLYQDELLGRAPRFPREIEDGISHYLVMLATAQEAIAADAVTAGLEVSARAAQAAGGSSVQPGLE